MSLAEHYEKYDDPTVTRDKILSRFAESDRTEIAEKIATAAKRLQFPRKTQRTSRTGSTAESRKRLHNEILTKIFNAEALQSATPGRGETPSFVVLGGRGGSGKSSFSHNSKTGADAKLKEFDSRKHIVLDSDAIKEMLKPPYEGWNAFNVHEESSELFETAIKFARQKGLNVVNDATMKSRSVEKEISKFKKEGVRDRRSLHVRATAGIGGEGSGAVPGPGGQGTRPAGTGGHHSGPIPRTRENFDHLKKYFDKWSAYDNQGDRSQADRAWREEKMSGGSGRH